MAIKIQNKNGNINLYWTNINFSRDGDYYIAAISKRDPYLTMNISLLIKIHSDIFIEENNYSKKMGKLKLEKNEKGGVRIKYKFSLKDMTQSFKEEINKQGMFIFNCFTTPIETSEEKQDKYHDAKRRFGELDRKKQSDLIIPPLRVFRGGLVSPK